MHVVRADWLLLLAHNRSFALCFLIDHTHVVETYKMHVCVDFQYSHDALTHASKPCIFFLGLRRLQPNSDRGGSDTGRAYRFGRSQVSVFFETLSFRARRNLIKPRNQIRLEDISALVIVLKFVSLWTRRKTTRSTTDLFWWPGISHTYA